MIILAVLAGGMIGAPARYLTDRFVQAKHDTVFPWGTYTVNMAGSAVLGFLLGAERHLGLPPVLLALLGTGFCGGLTTFSTFGYETLRLLEDGAVGAAGLNVIGSLAVGVLLAWLGFELAGALLITIPAPIPAVSVAGHRTYSGLSWKHSATAGNGRFRTASLSGQSARPIPATC